MLSDAVQCKGGFTSEVGTLLLNIFKWFTRQLSLHGLLPNDVLRKKLYWTQACTTPSSYIYKRIFKTIVEITGWGGWKRVLKTQHRGPWVFPPALVENLSLSISRMPMMLQEWFFFFCSMLLHTNKAILNLLSVYPCHIPTSPLRGGFSRLAASDLIFWV